MTAPGTYSGSVSTENSRRLPGNEWRTIAYAAGRHTTTLMISVSAAILRLHSRLSPKLVTTYAKFCAGRVPPGPVNE